MHKVERGTLFKAQESSGVKINKIVLMMGTGIFQRLGVTCQLSMIHL